MYSKHVDNLTLSGRKGFLKMFKRDTYNKQLALKIEPSVFKCLIKSLAVKELNDYFFTTTSVPFRQTSFKL